MVSTCAGILDPDEKPDEDPDDEILNELRRKQSELRVLSQHNLMLTKRLYKLAKEEMARQDLRRKGVAADAEVGRQHACMHRTSVVLNCLN